MLNLRYDNQTFDIGFFHLGRSNPIQYDIKVYPRPLTLLCSMLLTFKLVCASQP